MKTKPTSMLAAGAAELAVAGPLPVVLCPPIRRIVTFHHNGLCELLFTLPALHTLREAFPDAQICTVVRPGLAALLDDSPLVSELLTRPKGGLSEQATLMARLAAGHCDIALSFSPSRQCSLLAFATRAPVRIGYHGAKMESLLTHHVMPDGPFTIEAGLDLVRALGVAPRQLDYGGLLQLAPEHSFSVNTMLHQQRIEGPFLVANVTGESGSGKQPIREWPLQSWALALGELSRRWPIVLVGARPAPHVAEMLTVPCADFGGKLSLPQMAVLCGKAKLCLGTDGGIFHLAATMQTPVVGLYGPTNWQETGPRGVAHRIVRQSMDCAPCLLEKCKFSGPDERKCLTQLTPGQVVAAVRDLIGI